MTQNKIAFVPLINRIPTGLPGMKRPTDAIATPSLSDKDLNKWSTKRYPYTVENNLTNTFQVNDGVTQANDTGYRDQYNGHGPHDSSYSFDHLKLKDEFYFESYVSTPSYALQNTCITFNTDDSQTMLVKKDSPMPIETLLLDDLNRKNVLFTKPMYTQPSTNTLAHPLFTTPPIGTKFKTYRGDQQLNAELIASRGVIIKCVFEKNHNNLNYPKAHTADRVVDLYNPRKRTTTATLPQDSLILRKDVQSIEFQKIIVKTYLSEIKNSYVSI